MRIGFDLDGVLANFTDPYAALLTKHAERLFPPRLRLLFPKASDEWPVLWHWHKPVFEEAGFSESEMREVVRVAWDDLKSSSFWENLPSKHPAQTAHTLSNLTDWARSGHDVYFITSRPGPYAKVQSEQWLRNKGYYGTPTVCIAQHKGPIAQSLELDLFVDDRPENIRDVYQARSGRCRVALIDAPYNRDPGPVLEGLRYERHSDPEGPLLTLFKEGQRAA